MSLCHPVLACISSPSNRSCSYSPSAAGGCRRRQYAVAKAPAVQLRQGGASRSYPAVSASDARAGPGAGYSLYGWTSRATVAVSGPGPRARFLSRCRPPTSKPATSNTRPQGLPLAVIDLGNGVELCHRPHGAGIPGISPRLPGGMEGRETHLVAPDVVRVGIGTAWRFGDDHAGAQLTNEARTARPVASPRSAWANASQC